MQRRSRYIRAGIIERARNSRQSNLLLEINTNERIRGTRNSERTTIAIYTRGGCYLQGNLVVNADGVFPRWSEGPGTLRPLVGSKGEVGKGVLTIASFTDMTTPTLTQRPATSTIIPGSTILNGVEGTLGRDVRRGWSMGQRSRARCWLTSNGAGRTSVEVV